GGANDLVDAARAARGPCRPHPRRGRQRPPRGRQRPPRPPPAGPSRSRGGDHPRGAHRLRLDLRAEQPALERAGGGDPARPDARHRPPHAARVHGVPARPHRQRHRVGGRHHPGARHGALPVRRHRHLRPRPRPRGHLAHAPLPRGARRLGHQGAPALHHRPQDVRRRRRPRGARRVGRRLDRRRGARDQRPRAPPRRPRRAPRAAAL
ncbi:MAG: hypothetical protein AVDCRST_MAG40-2830, partial [uncultured Gemmatimonadaceae bacterium]